MFRDRRHAGALLGERVRSLALSDPVVLGLPRGGVVVAAEVARALGAPLDVLVVRQLGAPGNPELGIGAIAEDGITVLNDALIARLRVSPAEIEAVAEREQRELVRRTAAFRRGGQPLSLAGRSVVVVDDGLATGFTARAAVAALAALGRRCRRQTRCHAAAPYKQPRLSERGPRMRAATRVSANDRGGGGDAGGRRRDRGGRRRRR